LRDLIPKSLHFFLLALLPSCTRAPSLVPLPAPQAESCRARPVSSDPSAAVRWFGPDRPDDYRELWWRCIGVGPAVIWRPGPGESEAIDSLLLVSWNVHVGGAHLAEFINDLKAGKLTGGRPVRHFVLLLQEAYRGGLDSPPTGFIGARALVVQPARPPRVDILESAHAFGLHLYYVPSTRNGNHAENREDRGNAILSTLPLSDFAAYELPFEIHRRVALSAVIAGRTSEGEPWRLVLGVAHLDATLVRVAMWRDLGYGRKRQARSLATLWGQEPAIVVAGDFNTLFKGEWALRIFERSIGRIPGSDGRPTRPPFQPDHMFARLPDGWHIRPYRRLESSYHSDHYGLMTWIAFTRS
jgi:endonuclease/exonuclease/phosphatase family metal-dependent hydrolase